MRFILAFLLSTLSAILNSTYASLTKNEYKVVVFGPASAGKSSFLNRLLHGKSLTPATVSRVPPTIGVTFYQLVVDTNMTLHFWDTAGQERYFSAMRQYARHARVAIFVYDVSSERSLEEMALLFDKVMEVGLDECLLLVVGLKKDLLSLDRQDGLLMADSLMGNRGIGGFYVASAMDSDNDFEGTKTSILTRIINHCNHVKTNEADDRIITLQESDSDQSTCEC